MARRAPPVSIIAAPYISISYWANYSSPLIIFLLQYEN